MCHLTILWSGDITSPLDRQRVKKLTLIDFVSHCCGTDATPANKSRLSLGHTNDFNANISFLDFRNVLLFVNRGTQCDEYMTIVQRQWLTYKNALNKVPDLDGHAKMSVVVHSGGGKGTGKTTFARKAPDHCTPAMVWDEDFRKKLVEYTNGHGLRLKICFGNGLVAEDLEDMDRSLSLRVLHAHLQYRLKPAFASYGGFVAEARRRLGDVKFEAVLKEVVCCGITGAENRIVIMNFDELNAVLGSKRSDGAAKGESARSNFKHIEYMKHALVTIRDCTVYSEVFVFPILTGTKVIAVEELIAHLGMSGHAIPLPLLDEESVHQLFADLYRRARDVTGNPLGADEEVEIKYNLRLLLELMNGHPRFLEYLLYTLGGRTNETWSADLFVKNVDDLNNKANKNTQLRTVLLEGVSKALERYCSGWFTHYFEASNMEPNTLAVLLSMSLFDARVQRSDKIGFVHKQQLLVADLEQQGLVFLTPRRLGGLKLVVPFMWMHHIYSHLAAATHLPYVCLLDSLRCVMSPANKEELIMGVLALRMLMCSSKLKRPGNQVLVEDVLGVKVKGYVKMRLPIESNNQVNALDHQTLKDNQFVAGPGRTFFVNAPAAPTYDGLVLAEPGITVQSKNCLMALNKLATTDGRVAPATSYDIEIPGEILKCRPKNSILLLVTDDRIVNRPKELPKGLALIDDGNQSVFFGETLTLRFDSCRAATLTELGRTIHANNGTVLRRCFSVEEPGEESVEEPAEEQIVTVRSSTARKTAVVTVAVGSSDSQASPRNTRGRNKDMAAVVSGSGGQKVSYRAGQGFAAGRKRTFSAVENLSN
jgi:hypothetical protein